MDDRHRPIVAALIVCLGLSTAASIRAQHPGARERAVSFGPETSQQETVGTIGQENSRLTLEDDAGNVQAYLYASNSLNLNRYVGQRVSVTARALESVGSGAARLWVDDVTIAGTGAAARRNTASRTGSSPWPAALANFTEPVIAGPAVVYGDCVDALCGPPDRLWFDAQYLLWWTSGMSVPPLVTTSPLGTSREDAGVLGEPGTRILLGDQELLTQSRNGVRLRAGFWFDRANIVGIEGELFWLADEAFSYLAGCDAGGNPILARPFFNINPRNPFTLAFDPPAREDSQLVCYPDTLGGSVGMSASTRFYGASLALRVNLACDALGPDPQENYSRVDLLAGYRYLHLRDDLLITENLSALRTQTPVAFDIFDSFETRNEFHGLDLAMAWRAGWRRWWFEGLLRTAVGNSHQVVNINGGTTIVEGPTSTDYVGGLLAQSSNIGSHARNRWTLVPEIGVTVGYELLPRWNVTVGYSLLYWSTVVRAGDQIDLDVNPDQLAPPIDPLAGALRPAFAFEDSSFWAHGLSVGIEGRF